MHIYAGMQVCKYASMQVCKYACICKYTSMQVCSITTLTKSKCQNMRYTNKSEAMYMSAVAAFFPVKLKLFQICHIFTTKAWEFQSQFYVRPKDFMGTWFPGFPGLSRHAPHPTRKLSTVTNTTQGNEILHTSSTKPP